MKNPFQKIPVPVLSVLILLLMNCLAGCHLGPGQSDADSAIRLSTRAKLKNGMTVEEINQVLGQPAEFRKGSGQRDDVAVYRVNKETFTLYFFHNSLTRVVSSHNPINR